MEALAAVDHCRYRSSEDRLEEKGHAGGEQFQLVHVAIQALGQGAAVDIQVQILIGAVDDQAAAEILVNGKTDALHLGAGYPDRMMRDAILVVVLAVLEGQRGIADAGEGPLDADFQSPGVAVVQLAGEVHAVQIGRFILVGEGAEDAGDRVHQP